MDPAMDEKREGGLKMTSSIETVLNSNEPRGLDDKPLVSSILEV